MFVIKIIGPDDILKLALINILRMHHLDIKNRYGRNKNINQIYIYLQKDLSKVEGEIYLQSFNHEEDALIKILEDQREKELNKLLDEMKHDLHPADYLYLKSRLSGNDREILFLLQQAFCICPENFRLFIMMKIYEFIVNDTMDLGILADHLDAIPDLLSEDVKRFTLTCRIVKYLKDEETIPADEFKMLLQNFPYPPNVYYSALYAACTNKNPEVVKLIYTCLAPADGNSDFLHQNVFGIVASRLGYHEEAVRSFEHFNIEDFDLAVQFELNLLYYYSRSLNFTGRQKESIDILRRIASNEMFFSYQTEAYYHAVIDLALHIYNNEETESMNHINKILHDIAEEYAEEVRGADYYYALAEKHMHLDEWEKALEFYKKSYSLNNDVDLQKKITNLERGLKKS